MIDMQSYDWETHYHVLLVYFELLIGYVTQAICICGL